MEEIDRTLIACILETIYQSDDTFLSHLIGPTPFEVYDKKHIADLINPAATIGTLNRTSDFSRLIHQIPTRKIFEIHDSLMWENYSLLFNKAILAKDKEGGKKVGECMPDNLKKKYEEFYKPIRNELYDQLTAYNKAYSENKDDKIWKQEFMPKLISAIEETQRKWINEGFKIEIEEFIDTQIADNVLSYSSLWSKWKGKFSEFLSLNADLKSAGSCFATFYVDFDELNQEEKWQKKSFTHDSITSVLLKNPFDEMTEDLTNYAKDVELFEISYIRLNIERIWLIPQVFESRFWKMSPNFSDEIVSGEKFTGTIPTYIKDVIFIKRLSKQIRKSFIEDALEGLGKPLEWVFNKFSKKQSTNKVDENFYLAAMNCKLITKCPNPDPNLNWT
ncbi:hypothetical protein EXU85_18220 [Spirosoma sp. KCTC 42546]|uniref:hypothetical protein n=1 Tax=Spirosoma sp. KCTC 42546 TaxID=2520506 RepID=UPI00115A5855|nr:hypothetical protein [Spirosoma sp. KCTC 42546]QDK80435.1 hypothetical protein EXU85_18220 [Spirosoma sp. KCTC 42546]